MQPNTAEDIFVYKQRQGFSLKLIDSYEYVSCKVDTLSEQIKRTVVLHLEPKSCWSRDLIYFLTYY